MEFPTDRSSRVRSRRHPVAATAAHIVLLDLPRIAFLVLVLAALALSFSIASPSTAPDRDAAARLGLSRLTLQRLRLESAPRAAALVLDLDGRRVTVRLERASLRGPDFRVLAARSDGTLAEVAPPPPHTYRGTIAEIPGSVVGGTIVNGRLTAAIGLGDGRLFFVQPMVEGTPGADPALHVVYPGEAALADSGICSAHEPQVPVTSPPHLGPVSEAATMIADIAFDADFEFFTLNGGTVNATVDDIETVMSGVNVVYERDCGLSHRIGTVIVRSTEPDPYSSTDPDVLLDAMVDHWNAAQTAVPRDVAHLMTGKDVDGGVIGIASVGVVCSRSRAYGLSQSRFSSNFGRRTSLTAHELGHNWDAVHCDQAAQCNIMCSSINGCDGIGLPNFEPQGIDDIRAFAATRTCLDSPPMAVEPALASSSIRLAPAEPSPFRLQTTLSFFLAEPGHVSLAIYDLAGHRVVDLADGSEGGGWHSRTWNGLDRGGRRLGPGVFYARLEARGETRTRKLVLIR